MRITINGEVLERYNITLEEYFLLYLYAKRINIESLTEKLIRKGFANKDLFNSTNAILSTNDREIISSILIDSEDAVLNKDEEYLQLAKEMQEIFPGGKKIVPGGKTYYWRGSAPAIAKRLKTVVAKFNFGFTKEQALSATRRYVESFEGDTTYMQLLEYFVFKTNPSDGTIKSDFMSYIQNEDQEDEDNSTDWTTNII